MSLTFGEPGAIYSSVDDWQSCHVAYPFGNGTALVESPVALAVVGKGQRHDCRNAVEEIQWDKFRGGKTAKLPSCFGMMKILYLHDEAGSVGMW